MICTKGRKGFDGCTVISLGSILRKLNPTDGQRLARERMI